MNFVSGKISCIYECIFVDELTNKPNRKTKKRLTTKNFNQNFEKDLLNEELTYIVTGKIDGTCCRIKDGKLQKRRDIKKGRKIPLNWEATSNKLGHRIGYMPLDKGDKWHIDCMDGDFINVLRYKNNKTLIVKEKLSELEGKSVELIGPKIQGNLHKVDKHCVYLHGSIELEGFPNDFDRDKLKVWFINNEKCKYFEGIVVHFSNGNLYKLHRHHLDLKVENGYPSLKEFV